MAKFAVGEKVRVAFNDFVFEEAEILAAFKVGYDSYYSYAFRIDKDLYVAKREGGNYSFNTNRFILPENYLQPRGLTYSQMANSVQGPIFRYFKRDTSKSPELAIARGENGLVVLALCSKGIAYPADMGWQDSAYRFVACQAPDKVSLSR
jgi:hypothetical protein